MDCDDDLPDVDVASTAAPDASSQPHFMDLSHPPKKTKKKMVMQYLSTEEVNELMNRNPFPVLNRRHSQILDGTFSDSLNVSLPNSNDFTDGSPSDLHKKGGLHQISKDNLKLLITDKTCEKLANDKEIIDLCEDYLPDIGGKNTCPAAKSSKLSTKRKERHNDWESRFRVHSVDKKQPLVSDYFISNNTKSKKPQPLVSNYFTSKVNNYKKTTKNNATVIGLNEKEKFAAFVDEQYATSLDCVLIQDLSEGTVKDNTKNEKSLNGIDRVASNLNNSIILLEDSMENYNHFKFADYKAKSKKKRTTERNLTVKQKTEQIRNHLANILTVVGSKELMLKFSCPVVHAGFSAKCTQRNYSDLCYVCNYPVVFELTFFDNAVQGKMIRKWLSQARRALTEYQHIQEILSRLRLTKKQLAIVFWKGFTPRGDPSSDGGRRHRGRQLPDGEDAEDRSTFSDPPGARDEEDALDEENLGVAETYADYMPVKLKIGRKHPDQVVETASMSSVEPPDVWYKLALPASTIDECKLSALQLESIVYTAQQHEHILPDGNRAGFLIGDGAGVGKGRTIAGIIFENYLKGRKKALWVSVSNDLKFDAERDFKDIGASHITMHFLNKFKYGKIDRKGSGGVQEGVVFCTYSALIGKTGVQSRKNNFTTRLSQILDWCGADFDGCIIFDECHRAKNLCPSGHQKSTQTGQAVLQLQNTLPKARVVYASATGASEPKNMAYMVRLGIWGIGTPFQQFEEFIAAINKRGMGAMEIVAMDMKLRGMYMARQLSFHGTSFKIQEVPLSRALHDTYDEAVDMWAVMLKHFTAAALLSNKDGMSKKNENGNVNCHFWAAHQRFFKYLCIAAKVPSAVSICLEAVEAGKCAVVGLQSTGEARTLEALTASSAAHSEGVNHLMEDFISTAAAVVDNLLEKQFPVPDKSKSCNNAATSATTTAGTTAGTTATAGPNRQSKRKRSRRGGRKARKRRHGGSSVLERWEQQMEDIMIIQPSEEKKSRVKRIQRPIRKSLRRSYTEYFDTDVQEVNEGGGNEDATSGSDGSATTDYFSGTSDTDTDDGCEAEGGFNETEKSATTNEPQVPSLPLTGAYKLKAELYDLLNKLRSRLPPNTLDELIHNLGGADKVAEMTGRKGRMVAVRNGAGVMYETRAEDDVPLDMLNIREKERFMQGAKYLAIISEAASSGISLQSDRRVHNQRRRVHITLELPWSADRAIQQFGRTHRSNQVNAPEYVFLISALAGERRFASIVAKRLESLGALTHGDRRAAQSRDLSSFNIDNKYGRSALDAFMRTVVGEERPIVPAPVEYKGDFFADVKTALVAVGVVEIVNEVTKEARWHTCTISKFLNRLLGVRVDLQNSIFRYFTDTLTAFIVQAKKTGRFDQGILDLCSSSSDSDGCLVTRTVTWLSQHVTGEAITSLHAVQVTRGMAWQDAENRRLCHLQDTHAAVSGGEGGANQQSKLMKSRDGYYVNRLVRSKHVYPLLVLCCPSLRQSYSSNLLGSASSSNAHQFMIFTPNVGKQVTHVNWIEVNRKYKKVTAEQAEKLWHKQYDDSATKCSHAVNFGLCRRRQRGLQCDTGMRLRTFHVLCGSVINLWKELEGLLLTGEDFRQARMQVVRFQTKNGTRMVGTLIPNHLVDGLIDLLKDVCCPLADVLHEEDAAINTPKPEEKLHSDATSNQVQGEKFKLEEKPKMDDSIFNPETKPKMENIKCKPERNPDAENNKCKIEEKTNLELFKFSHTDIKSREADQGTMLKENRTVEDGDSGMVMEVAAIKNEKNDSVVVAIGQTRDQDFNDRLTHSAECKSEEHKCSEQVKLFESATGDTTSNENTLEVKLKPELNIDEDLLFPLDEPLLFYGTTNEVSSLDKISAAVTPQVSTILGEDIDKKIFNSKELKEAFISNNIESATLNHVTSNAPNLLSCQLVNNIQSEMVNSSATSDKSLISVNSVFSINSLANNVIVPNPVPADAVNNMRAINDSTTGSCEIEINLSAVDVATVLKELQPAPNGKPLRYHKNSNHKEKILEALQVAKENILKELMINKRITVKKTNDSEEFTTASSKFISSPDSLTSGPESGTHSIVVTKSTTRDCAKSNDTIVAKSGTMDGPGVKLIPHTTGDVSKDMPHITGDFSTADDPDTTGDVSKDKPHATGEV